jgi:predicted aldo/keto reductase-like oxidoreductase
MGWGAGIQQYAMNTGVVSSRSTGPENCVACGTCENHCPQKISITENLKTVRKKMEPVPVMIVLKAVRGFMRSLKKSY